MSSTSVVCVISIFNFRFAITVGYSSTHVAVKMFVDWDCCMHLGFVILILSVSLGEDRGWRSKGEHGAWRVGMEMGALVLLMLVVNK